MYWFVSVIVINTMKTADNKCDFFGLNDILIRFF